MDDVEGLLRRHDDFNSKLLAQDDRLKALNELADRLIAEGHPDADQSVLCLFACYLSIYLPVCVSIFLPAYISACLDGWLMYYACTVVFILYVC